MQLFSLSKCESSITNVNVRREKHGKEGKLGIDISVAMHTVNTKLDELQDGLREALYRKADKGEQMDIIDGAGALVGVKFPQLEPLKLDLDLPAYEVDIGGNLESSKSTLLVDVKLKDFVIKPVAGGSASIAFKMQTQANLQELSEVVDWWMNESITLSLTPPAKQQ